MTYSTTIMFVVLSVAALQIIESPSTQSATDLARDARAIRLRVLIDEARSNDHETCIYCVLVNEGEHAIVYYPRGMRCELSARGRANAEPVPLLEAEAVGDPSKGITLSSGSVYGYRCILPYARTRYENEFKVDFYYILFNPGRLGQTGAGAVAAVVYPDRIDWVENTGTVKERNGQ